MEETNKSEGTKLKRRIWKRIAAAGCVLIVLLFTIFYSTYAGSVLNRAIVHHIVIVKAVRENVSSGHQIPATITELKTLSYDNGGQTTSISPSVCFEEEHHGLKYYPNAWDKPERIFLRSYACGMYVVTFGKGSFAVLQSWHYRTLQQEKEGSLSREEESLQAGIGNPYWMSGVVVILSVVLLVLIFKS